MAGRLRKLLRDQSGGTAIEHALIGMLVSVLIVGGITLVGNDLRDLYYGAVANAFEARVR